MRVDIWSDLVCPWCYIGKRRFEQALATFEHRDAVQVVHRSFQLDPSSPRGVTEPRRARLKAKYHISDDQVATMDERLEQLAAEVGLTFDLSGGNTGNTFDAHRIVHLARARGKEDAMIERFYRAYFTDATSIFDDEAIVALAVEAGLDEAEVRAVLASDQYADAVTTDATQAAELGTSGVPFFVLGGRYGVSGAQPVDVFTQALTQAWDDPKVEK